MMFSWYSYLETNPSLFGDICIPSAIVFVVLLLLQTLQSYGWQWRICAMVGAHLIWYVDPFFSWCSWIDILILSFVVLLNWHIDPFFHGALDLTYWSFFFVVLLNWQYWSFFRDALEMITLLILFSWCSCYFDLVSCFLT